MLEVSNNSYDCQRELREFLMVKEYLLAQRVSIGPAEFGELLIDDDCRSRLRRVSLRQRAAAQEPDAESLKVVRANDADGYSLPVLPLARRASRNSDENHTTDVPERHRICRRRRLHTGQGAHAVQQFCLVVEQLMCLRVTRFIEVGLQREQSFGLESWIY